MQEVSVKLCKVLSYSALNPRVCGAKRGHIVNMTHLEEHERSCCEHDTRDGA